jgi:hypothetical protein
VYEVETSERRGWRCLALTCVQKGPELVGVRVLVAREDVVHHAGIADIADVAVYDLAEYEVQALVCAVS